MSPGGIIFVDDCMPHAYWDGALAAYEEFVAQRGLERRIAFDKIGVIRKA
jgi:hypothetical protein